MLLLPCLATSQNGTVSVGKFLTAGEKSESWLSPSMDFAFGFHQLDNKDLFLLAIWYYKIPSKTVVWYALSDKPVPRGSKIQLTADRGLALDDPDGTEIWKSDIGMHQADAGFIYDTGNFLIVDTNSEKLWQSFDHPTDTLLPTQIMERGGVVSSRRTETDFSQGRFQFRLLEDGNAVLNTINLPSGLAYDAYFWSNTFDLNISNAGTRVVFDGSGYLYVLRQNSRRVDITPGVIVSAKENYYRATLNFDGVFILYSHPKNSIGNGVWSAIYTMPDDICVGISGGLGSGACGFNNICSLNDQRPKCNCPKGYSLIDKNDVYGSCKPDFELSCNEETQNSIEDLYDFFEINDIDWPTSDYEFYEGYNEVECRNSCLQDCLCAVAISRKGCWKKKLPLSNGRVDNTLNAKAFIKYRKGDVPPSVPHHPADADKEGNLMSLTASLLLGSSVFINFILVGAFGFGFFFIYKKKFVRVRQGESTMETNLRCFTYKELAEATDNFKEEVGRGKSIDVEMGGENYEILTDWAFDCYRSGKLDVLVEGDMEALSAVREVERFLMVAIWCIQEDPSLRPTMRKVTQMLEGVVEVAVPPNPSPD
ncbi:hypothetical protein QYF36_026886 [Acer negundo]|nr:hypothetical protein QYF36_026886 [Acer negundo]